MHPPLRVNPEDASVTEILEHIVDGMIVFDPSARLLLPLTDFKNAGLTAVLAPERRRRPFIIPPKRVKVRKTST